MESLNTIQNKGTFLLTVVPPSSILLIKSMTKENILVNTKQMLWKFLISNGQVSSSRSYYGNCVAHELTLKWKSIATLDNFADYIDWDESGEVCDGLMRQFSGTFCDNPPVKVLEGTLVTTKGQNLDFVLELEDINLTDLILKVIQSASDHDS